MPTNLSLHIFDDIAKAKSILLKKNDEITRENLKTLVLYYKYLGKDIENTRKAIEKYVKKNKPIHFMEYQDMISKVMSCYNRPFRIKENEPISFSKEDMDAILEFEDEEYRDELFRIYSVVLHKVKNRGEGYFLSLKELSDISNLEGVKFKRFLDLLKEKKIIKKKYDLYRFPKLRMNIYKDKVLTFVCHEQLQAYLRLYEGKYSKIYQCEDCKQWFMKSENKLSKKTCSLCNMKKGRKGK